MANPPAFDFHAAMNGLLGSAASGVPVQQEPPIQLATGANDPKSSPRPYAVAQYRDKFAVHSAARTGKTVTEGYYVSRPRYASSVSAQAQADYRTLFDPAQPAYVVDTRTGERIDPSRGRMKVTVSLKLPEDGLSLSGPELYEVWLPGFRCGEVGAHGAKWRRYSPRTGRMTGEYHDTPEAAAKALASRWGDNENADIEFVEHTSDRESTQSG